MTWGHGMIRAWDDMTAYDMKGIGLNENNQRIWKYLDKYCIVRY